MTTTAALDAIRTMNPFDGSTLAEYSLSNAAAVERALATAAAAFPAWRDAGFAPRAELFRNVAAHLRDHKRELGLLITSEMGKPLAEAEGEVEKCALGCDYYAAHAETILADEHIASNASASYVSFNPLGVVLAI